MQNVKSAVIAAAGLGSRLGLGLPKCMIEIGGQTILSRLVNTLKPHVEIINIVVGYREEIIIEYCARYHRDVVIVRNPDYQTTNTAYSLAKGARYLSGKVIYLDGDLLVSPESLSGFLDKASTLDVLVGMTDAKSADAVYVHGNKHDGYLELTHFSRKEPSGYEWANLVSGPADLLKNANGYVFEKLSESLPLIGIHLDVAEVDTVEDLSAAKIFAMGL